METTPYREAELERMTRGELLIAAAELGLRARGLSEAELILWIERRQSELSARAATPLEVRLLRLEDSVAAVEIHLARIGRIAAELFAYVIQRRRGVVSEAARQDAAYYLQELSR